MHTTIPPLERPAQPAQQLRYAALLERGTRIGLVVLTVSFFAYISGLLPAHVPPESLPRLWGQPVGHYLAQTHSPTGWGLLAILHRSDILGLAGIVILSGCSVVCLVALVPMYAARRDTAFVALCLAEALVVLVAASGVLA